jgi:hypothetical protein
MGSKQRILQYLDFKKIGKRDFSRDTELSHTILNSGKNLGSDKLEKIISVYSDLNLFWVVTGLGSMILSIELQKTLIDPDSSKAGKSLDKSFQSNFIKAISKDKQSREILTLFVKTIFNQMYATKTAELLMDEDIAKDLIAYLTKSLKEGSLNVD